MRKLMLVPSAFLMACEETVENGGSVAFEGRSKLTVTASDDPDGGASAISLDGRYGASAADCEHGNRYMTEYVEIDGPTLAYRGQQSTIAIVRDNVLVLRGGEELQREGDTLVRWADQRRKRTAYTRCRQTR